MKKIEGNGSLLSVIKILKENNAMSLWMQEIAESPIETVTTTTFTAIRYFMVQWNRRNDFETLFFGANGTYPGRTGIVVRQITFEPLSPSFFDNSAVTDPLSELGESGWGKATVVYGDAETTDDAILTPYVCGLLENR